MTEGLKIIRAIASAKSAFFILPPLMVLLIVGTIAQKYMGLYAAHQMYFASFYFWAGPVPLPGGYTLLALLTIPLTLKFLFYSRWSLAKSGINITHLGVLVLLIGGLLTAITAREGFMAIAEGESSHFVYDYHERELRFFGDLERSISLSGIRAGENIEGLPFRMKVLGKCENCNIVKRVDHPEPGIDESTTYRSMAQFMALTPAPLEKEAEINISGLTVHISGADEDSNGIYILFEAMPAPLEITSAQSENIQIILGKQQRQIPFEITLKDFVKTDYPGLPMARAYHSDIMVRDGALEFPVRIEMNKPLRHGGYTFYQSSFDIAPGVETTVLSVVENTGWLFPYIGTGIILIGLLLHLIMRASKGKKEEGRR